MTRLSIALALAALTLGSARADGPDGAKLYAAQCARCHGAAGEGSKKYKPALAGDLAVPQLADVIRRTMPESDPESLTPAEATAIASHMHAAFYSKESRERNKPPRVDLARLTVNQYRNAVADVVGSFRPPPAPDAKPGLRGEYFEGRNFRNDRRVFERLDPRVVFDFDRDSPGEGITPHEFAARWQGTVTPPETGFYEFTVRSDQSVRLWVNDPNRPLVDAYVKSGSGTDFTGSRFLLAGRAYAIRLEFSKALQGVQDKDAKKKPPALACVALLWKRPHGEVEPIPPTALSPGRASEAFVPETTFPPDDRSMGWERGTAVSKAWDQATTDAALETAAYVLTKLPELAGVSDAPKVQHIQSGNPAGGYEDGPAAKPDPQRVEKLRAFARLFVARAFRAPLSDELQSTYVDRIFAVTPKPDLAVKRVVVLALKSPRFLYREVAGGPAQTDVANRLAFALWDSAPDKALLDAAAAGKLAAREQVAAQAERMLADPRARAKLAGLFRHWLKVEHVSDLAKDPKRFPGFDATLAGDLRTSLELFVDDVMWDGASDFRRLLLSDTLFLNDRLARFYGTALPPGDGFRKATLDPAVRTGVLTHPFLLSAFAYTGASSPIHRGVFLARGVLGVVIKPPSEAFTPLAEDLHPGLTTRERTALQTKGANCQTCHSTINALGFALENFDAVGRYRAKDNDKPVDASGRYHGRDGKTTTFIGAKELARFLADSPEVHAAFAQQMFHHLAQQPVRAYGPDTLDKLTKTFAASGFNMRKLAVEVATTAALEPSNR